MVTNGLLSAGELALKHSLPVELVIVEWNPPPDAARLRDALRWPDALLDVLIVTQPPLETPLGQMAPPKRGRVQECHLIQVAF